MRWFFAEAALRNGEMMQEQNAEKMLQSEAEALPFAERKKLIETLKETDLHKQLKALFSKMDTNLEVVLTHGPNELGKDLVLVNRDPISISARAIVVKCGNITGKANGPIDEIKSQVQMCLDHPYSASGIEDIQISQVIVVTSGSISEGAKTRLSKEFSCISCFYDISKLVELFTKYYPRVFFGGYEYDYCSTHISTLDNGHLFSEKGKTLSQCFVEPKIRRPDIALQQTIQKRKKKALVSFADLVSIASGHERIMLTGEEKKKKTAVLKMIAITILRNRREKIRSGERIESVPVFCEARLLTQCEDAESLIAAVSEEIYLVPSFEINCLLIDGIDEIEPNFRVQLSSILLEVSDKCNITVITTARNSDHFEDTAEWSIFEIDPFQTTEALSLCTKAIDDEKIINSLRTGIKQINRGFNLTPLSIFLLVGIIEERQEVPASITELYEQYIDNVLGKGDKDKGIKVLFEYELKKRFLGALAFEQFLQSDTDCISIQNFDKFGKQYFIAFDWPLDHWEILLEELKRSCLLSIDDRANTISFKHRSFLEFFSAYYLHTDPEAEQYSFEKATELYFNELWTDVAFYFYGLKKSVTKSSLEKIFDYKNENVFGLICKMRAGRLIQAGWHSRAEAKVFGLTKASHYAAPVRQSILAWRDEAAPSLPDFAADVVLFSISTDSFGSVFLQQHIKQLLDEAEPNSEEDMLSRICLFTGLAALLPSNEKALYAERIANSISLIPDKAFVGRGLFTLFIVISDDDKAKKSIERKIKSFAKNYPSLTKSLLPAVGTK